MNTLPASIAGDWVDMRVTLSPSGFIGMIPRRLLRSCWIRPVPEPASRDKPVKWSIPANPHYYVLGDDGRAPSAFLSPEHAGVGLRAFLNWEANAIGRAGDMLDRPPKYMHASVRRVLRQA
jgi:hypothetical protein